MTDLHDFDDQRRDNDGDDAAERYARRIAEPMRAPETLDDSFEARLMARVERAAAADEGPVGPRRDIPRTDIPRTDIPRGPSPAADIPRRHAPTMDIPRRPAAWRRLTSARTVRISPLGGLALAAGLAGVAVLGTASVMRDRQAPVVAQAAPAAPAAAPAPDTVRVVQFVLVAPGAARVSLVGDFNDWDAGATPLDRANGGQGGLWSVEVPLAAGRHEYAFIVDGTRWVLDPSAPTTVGDDFGSPSSVVTVGERAS